MKPPIVLDASPTGLLTNPNFTPIPIAIRQWLDDLLQAGRRVILPEVVDYELRREFIRGNRLRALRQLDGLKKQVEYIPITTVAMLRASEVWATARNAGRPTASHLSLDCDSILVAQALELNTKLVVATANIAHIGLFLPAMDWAQIVP